MDKYLSTRLNILKRKNVLEKFKREFIPQTWENTAPDLYYAVFLQLIGSQTGNFFTIISILSALVVIISSIVMGFNKFRPLWYEAPSSPPLKKWIPAIEYCMLIVQPMILICFYLYPTHQLSLIWGSSIAALVIYLHSSEGNKKKIFLETACFFIYMLMAFFTGNRLTKDDKWLIGAGLIAIIVLVVIMELGIVLYQGYLSIKELLKTMKKDSKMKSSKAVLTHPQAIEAPSIKTKRVVKRLLGGKIQSNLDHQNSFVIIRNP